MLDTLWVIVKFVTSNKTFAFAFQVLKNALGTGPRVQWGNQSASALGKLTTKFAGNEPSALSAFNCSYSDSGLFGIMIVNGACTAGNLVCEAGKMLNSLESVIQDKDIARAKQITKLDGLLRLESGESCVSKMGRQALFCPKIFTPQEFASAVDNISAADVKQV